MNTNNEQKWREEFEKNYPDLEHDGEFNFILEKDAYRWRGYLAACKKRQEEVDLKDDAMQIMSEKIHALRAENELLVREKDLWKESAAGSSRVNLENRAEYLKLQADLEAAKKEVERLVENGNQISKVFSSTMIKNQKLRTLTRDYALLVWEHLNGQCPLDIDRAKELAKQASELVGGMNERNRSDVPLRESNL